MSTGQPMASTARSILTVSASSPRPGPIAMAEAFATTSGVSPLVRPAGDHRLVRRLRGDDRTRIRPRDDGEQPRAHGLRGLRAKDGRAGEAGAARDDGELAEIALIRERAAARKQAGQLLRARAPGAAPIASVRCSTDTTSRRPTQAESASRTSTSLAKPTARVTSAIDGGVPVRAARCHPRRRPGRWADRARRCGRSGPRARRSVGRRLRRGLRARSRGPGRRAARR